MSATTSIFDDPQAAFIALQVASRGVAIPEGGLTLDSAHIDKKWGFDDGDMPDMLLGMLEDAYGRFESRLFEPWRRVLFDLVSAHLIPLLDADAMPPIFFMSTIHNPVRTNVYVPRNLVHHTVTVPWLEVLVRMIHHLDPAGLPE